MGDYAAGPYAILSHTWENDEITLQEMLQRPTSLTQKAGYKKVQECAEVAARDAYEYVWVDTCCIDKTSSAELSEAINSMFRWYKNAGVCYAYLADVEDCTAKSIKSVDAFVLAGHMIKDINHPFFRSRWFTRGWTLQELIAPMDLVFYSSTWEVGAKKSEVDIYIKWITGIPEEILRTGDASLERIVDRMSWASSRSTTRVEDIAYCLMGIFDVNMPMLYGEGEKAFLRLQEEIARKSHDQTLFAWKWAGADKEVKPKFSLYRGLFAKSPKEFSDIRQSTDSSEFTELQETDIFTSLFISTNLGFNVKWPLIPARLAKEWSYPSCSPPIDTIDEDNEFLAILNVICEPEIWVRALDRNWNKRRLAIRLKRLLPDGRHYVRVRPDLIYTIETSRLQEAKVKVSLDPSDVYIQQSPQVPQTPVSSRIGGFAIGSVRKLYGEDIQYQIRVKDGSWSPGERVIRCPDKPVTLGVIGMLTLHGLARPFAISLAINFKEPAPNFEFLDEIPAEVPHSAPDMFAALRKLSPKGFPYLGPEAKTASSIRLDSPDREKSHMVYIGWRPAVINETYVFRVDFSINSEMIGEGGEGED